jgi:acyl CoA:acetate/3-ketoacid CoA transferase alpha subunit
VARQEFDNVVVDMGSRLDLMGTSLFKDGSTVYLVIQAGIAGLRNSNRLISQYFASGVPKLEIVLNRYQPRTLGVAEDQITKALTRPAQWKIPNDYNAVRHMQHTAVPLALEDSPISRLIRQMARTACGLPVAPEKGPGFSFKNFSRSISAKISSTEEAPSIPSTALLPSQENAVAGSGVAQADVRKPDATTIQPARADSAPAAVAATPEAETPAPPAPTDNLDRADLAEANEQELQSFSAPSQQDESDRNEPETRTYKGATYVRGVDAKWHLKMALAGEVSPETPDIEWPTPAPIAYGIALCAAQLNAMAPVPGTFVYSPAAGEVLTAGTHTLSVAFTPADAPGYTPAPAAVSLTVTKATPIITWPTPAAISHGEPLSSAQLKATALVPGVFVYTPAAGGVLSAGLHTLLAAFTPTDVEDYTAVQATVPLIVAKATPIVAWRMPSSIVYGTRLSAVELNATASVPGTFFYTPAAGEVLLAGWHTLSATFTPADAENYTEAQAAVSIRVTQATPVITWPAPDSIADDIALSAAQLNATASVPGTFVYTPSAGEVLSAGVYTLSAFFTPTDEENHAEVQATVQLTVTEATLAPVIEAAPSGVEIQDISQATPVTVETPAEADAEPTVEAVPTVEAGMELSDEAVAEQTAPTPAEPKVKAIVEPFVESAVETPVETAVEQPAEAAVAQPIEAVAKPPVEAAVAQPVEPVAEQPAEVPATALAKAAAPKFTFDEGAVMGTAVFKDGTKIYLVMQPGSAGLVSSNHMISQFFATGDPKPEIVINRYRPHSLGIGEEQAGVALTGSEHLPISRLIGQMAGAGSEQPATPEKKKGFSLKRLGQRIWSKISAAEVTDKFSHLGLDPLQQNAGPATVATGADGTAHSPRSSAQPTDSASNGQSEPETRVYKGDTYVLCVDGEWHLDQDRTRVMIQETPAVASPMPAPASLDTAPDGLQSNAKPEPEPAKIAPAPAGESASQAKTASAKAAAKHPAKAVVKHPAKAAAKHPVKAVAKPSAKVAAKHPAKANAKPSVKSAAKHPVIAVAKPSAKVAAKHPAKANAKPSVKSAAKHPVKAATKRPVKAATKRPVKAATKSHAKPPVRKTAPAKKKTLRSRPVKSTKPASRTSKPAAKKPSPKQAKKPPAKR